MRIFIISSVLALGGCVAPYTWQHPGLDSVAAERQAEIDSAECTAIAMQQVALPSEPAQTNISVNVSGNGSYGGAGRMTMTGSEAQAEQLRADALAQAEQERAALTNACMLRRGWVKVRNG